MKKILLTGIIFLLFSFPAISDTLNLLGTWNITNYIYVGSAGAWEPEPLPNYACDVANNILYTAAGNGIFAVDTSTNRVIGNFPLNDSDSAYDIVANGNYLYIADFNNPGVEIYNISNPASASYMYTFVEPEYQNIDGVFVSGNDLYLACGGDGLVIDDITNIATNPPAQIAKVATSNFSENVYVTVNSSDGNTYAYLNDEYEIQIINVTNPNAPSVAATYTPSSQVSSLCVVNNIAYLGELNGSVEVVNVSQAITGGTGPAYLNSVATLGPVYNITYFNNDLYLCENTSGVEVMDISTNPLMPASIGSSPTNGAASSCAVNNNTIYVSDTNAGLTEISESNLTSSSVSLSLIGSYFNRFNPMVAWTVKVAGNYAFIADAYGSLTILDVTNPQNPLFAGNLELPSGAQDLYADTTNNYAYMADTSGGLVVADITNPYAPAYVTGYATNDAATGIDMQGNNLYVAADYYNQGGLQAFGITSMQPFSAAPIGIYPDTGNGGTIYRVNVNGNYAYVADIVEMDVIDVTTNPSNPTLAGSVSPYNDYYELVTNVNVNSNFAYMAEYPGAEPGLGMADVTNANSPVDWGVSQADGNAWSVIYNTNYAYVACDTFGLDVFDMTNPYTNIGNNPVASLNLPGTAYGVYTNDGSSIYVADGTNGLCIVQHIRPTQTATPTMTTTITPTMTSTMTPTSTTGFTLTITPTETLKSVGIPTLTITPTFTMTYTITMTLQVTATPTQPFWTPTPGAFQIINNKVYPNPSYEGPINFGYTLTQSAQQVTIKIFTQGYRLIYETSFAGAGQQTNEGTDVFQWNVVTANLANGAYYYVIEATGLDGTKQRKIGSFIALPNLLLK